MPDATMIYFAYGSNMLLVRLRERVPSSRALGVAVLHDHRLIWTKRSVDGSGKCGIVPSTDCANVVWGRLFGIDDWDLVALDRAEGAGSGYERTTVVALAEGASVEAVTYVATRIDTDLPYEWYKRFVLAGAREARLPGAYIAWLEEVSTVRDPDDARRRTQLQLQAEIHGSPPP